MQHSTPVAAILSTHRAAPAEIESSGGAPTRILRSTTHAPHTCLLLAVAARLSVPDMRALSLPVCASRYSGSICSTLTQLPTRSWRASRSMKFAALDDIVAAGTMDPCTLCPGLPAPTLPAPNLTFPPTSSPPPSSLHSTTKHHPSTTPATSILPPPTSQHTHPPRLHPLALCMAWLQA